jgi:hypothetical protein
MISKTGCRFEMPEEDMMPIANELKMLGEWGEDWCIMPTASEARGLANKRQPAP